MQRISYCKGVIDVNNISPEVAHVLDRLENGENAGLSIEKLRGHHLYSCRLNDADRLLFTYLETNGERYLLLLDIVLNHDYAKSFATKPQALRNFIQLNGDVFKHHILREDFEPVNEPAAQTKDENRDNNALTKPKRHYIEMEFFNDHFIALNVEQTRARKVALPAKVNGAAGSGKSGTAFARITDLAEAMSQQGGDQLPDVCYVTQSSALCDNMRENFQATRQASLVPDGKISFKTYKDLINSKLTHVGFNEFEKFIAGEIKAHRQRCKANQPSNKKNKAKITSFTNEFYKNIEVMYQEMRIISGVKSDIEYLALGDNQSLFYKQQKAERVWLYGVYQNYLKYLASDNGKQPMIDLGCCPVTVEPRHCICIVDESQDLSPVQLQVLDQLSQGRVLYFYHKQQSLSDTLGKEYCLNEITNERQNKVRPIELKSSFRCPEAVLGVAQEFLDMGARLTGEAITQKPDSEIKDHRGTVKVWTDLTDLEEIELRNDAADPDCVIITNEGYLNEARQRFGKAVIVTVEQFKGLEATTVILYRLFDDKIYAKACEVLPQDENSKVQLINKAFGPAFNSAYTACTRVRGSGKLVIVQDNPATLHRIQPIIQRLKKHDTRNQHHSKKLTEEQIQDQLFRRVKELLGTKIESNIAIAKEIYIDKLHRTEEQFNELKSLYIAAQQPIVATVIPKPKAKPKKTTTNQKFMTPQEISNAIVQDNVKTLEQFHEYFTNPAYHHELFRVPSETGKECRFVEYMSHDNPRVYMHTIMRIQGRTLFRLPNFQFDRKTLTKPCPVNLMPPVFFFAMDNNIWINIVDAMKERKNPFSFTGIAAEVTNESDLAGMSAFYFLTTHESGLLSLAQVIQANLNILRKLPMKFFVHVPISEAAKRRSIMDNLLDRQLEDENFDALLALLDNIPSLAHNITVEHLTAKYKKSEIPRLVVFCSSVRGKSFLERLAALNPDIHQLGFCRMSIEQAQRYCDKPTQTKLTDPKQKYIQGLIANPIAANLSNLLTRNDAYVYLFGIPTDTGECLYARLRENEKTKQLLQSYIPYFIDCLFKDSDTIKRNYPLAKTMFYALNGGECLLTHLFDYEEIRTALLTACTLQSIIGFSGIAPAPSTAFVRLNRRPGKQDTLLWFCNYAPLTKVMLSWTDHEEMFEIIISKAFFRPVSMNEYIAANLPHYADVFRCNENVIVETGKQKSLQPWELLCLHSIGRNFMSKIDDSVFYNNTCLRFTRDLRIANSIHRKDITMTLFHLLSRDDHGKAIICLYLTHNQSSLDAIIKENLFLEGSELIEISAGNFFYKGNCALFEIFNSTGSAKIAQLILSYPYNYLEKAGIINALFHALTPFCHDVESEVIRFTNIFKHPDLADIICNFAQKYPMLYHRFDANLFLTETIHDIRHNAIAALKSIESGRILFDNIASYISRIKSLRKTTTDLQRISLFSNSAPKKDNDCSKKQEPKGP